MRFFPSSLSSSIAFTLHRVVFPLGAWISTALIVFPSKNFDHSVRIVWSTSAESPTKNPVVLLTVSCCGRAALRGGGALIMVFRSFSTVGTITPVMVCRCFLSAFLDVAVARYISLACEICMFPSALFTESPCTPPMASAFSLMF